MINYVWGIEELEEIWKRPSFFKPKIRYYEVHYKYFRHVDLVEADMFDSKTEEQQLIILQRLERFSAQRLVRK